VGINIEDKKRIFDRFYRVDDSRTKSTGGSGLGLAIVKRIVEIHDGKIEIESEYEVGTEISVVLSIIESKNEQIIEKSKENMVLKLPKKLINKKINK
nr:two-component sensor histidine kinase [Leptotrichiaceae bacterium]